MNAVEIEEAVSALAEQPFDAEEFPYLFLLAFGNKDTTIKRLRATKGSTNASDIPGAVLQRNNIHIATCPPGEVTRTLTALRDSPATSRAKAKFILATDGCSVEIEDVVTGNTAYSDYSDIYDHVEFLLPLAGISYTKELQDTKLDRSAARHLQKLYLDLLRDNPDWGTVKRRSDMNHFMARLIFCFFAERTGIFGGDRLFTEKVEKRSDRDSSNTHDVIRELFRAMDTPINERKGAGVPGWAGEFPYVNGGLFSGDPSVPRFSKIARSKLRKIGSLDWKEINPDIFGSMIQAVTDDEERGVLGMHYTSLPNILKVLNPLFLDDLRARLEEAGENSRMLLNLRRRMARIRVFDPACGSGNFLVLAYKEMRAIEAEINKRRRESDRPSAIPLTNFRGIELKNFPAEIARLALIIAEFQCDSVYRGQKLALDEFLPLNKENWITCDNALRIDWLDICPPTGAETKRTPDDLFDENSASLTIDFENEGGETYICGNPPFKGTRKQGAQEKEDLQRVFSGITTKWKNVDYVGAWLMKAALYNEHCYAPFSFVATNSICQGQQVPITWSILQSRGFRIRFAYSPFKWSNLATNKAGVTVVITGVDRNPKGARYIYTDDIIKEVNNINPYLTHHEISAIPAEKKPLFTSIAMQYGVYYSKSSGLILTSDEKDHLLQGGLNPQFLRRFIGSTEYINGKERYCLWIDDKDLPRITLINEVRDRIEAVRRERLETADVAVNKLAQRPHQFREYKGDDPEKIFIPIVSSESREYFPAGLADDSVIPTNKAFYIPSAFLWVLGIILSRTHLVWIGTVCGRLEMRFSYSNTLGWNTFPIPTLTDKMKADLTRCAEDILLAREAHFPATIAELYDPEKMPADLREAHERNDEVLERIYIGRRFRNDTERLEKLFDLYTKMTAGTGSKKKVKA